MTAVPPTPNAGNITGVIFDLGGVVFPSPFEAFDTYDARNALAVGTTRSIIRTSSESGAWAALERGELTHVDFYAALEAEGRAAGFTIDAAKIMATIGESSGARPEMLNAIASLRANGFKVGALTNNWADDRNQSTPLGLSSLDIFDTIVESARVGLRKPDPRIYEMVCGQLGVAPPQCAFLDDLGINLKPAKAMGMTTIKVVDPIDALRELSAVVGLELV